MNEKQIQENIDSGNWEISSYAIICPCCGYKKSVDYEMCFGDSCPNVYEEGEEEITCPECKHRFKLTKEIEWNYTTEVIE